MNAHNVIKYFETMQEAVAFTDGIEFVNDSSIEVTDMQFLKEQKKFAVYIIDDEFEDDYIRE